PRNVQTVELLDELGRIAIEPLGERHHWGRIDRNCFATSSLLDASVPRADVLADVASIDHVTHLRAECLRNRRWRLAPVGETLRGVEGPRLVERTRRACVDAESALSAVERKHRSWLDLDLRYRDPEDDPRAMALRDRHGVLAVARDAGSNRGCSVHVIVVVDEHAIPAAQPTPAHAA